MARRTNRSRAPKNPPQVADETTTEKDGDDMSENETESTRPENPEAVGSEPVAAAPTEEGAENDGTPATDATPDAAEFEAAKAAARAAITAMAGGPGAAAPESVEIDGAEEDEAPAVYDGPDLDANLTAGEDSPSLEDTAPVELVLEAGDASEVVATIEPVGEDAEAVDADAEREVAADEAAAAPAPEDFGGAIEEPEADPATVEAEAAVDAATRAVMAMISQEGATDAEADRLAAEVDGPEAAPPAVAPAAAPTPAAPVPVEKVEVKATAAVSSKSQAGRTLTPAEAQGVLEAFGPESVLARTKTVDALIKDFADVKQTFATYLNGLLGTEAEETGRRQSAELQAEGLSEEEADARVPDDGANAPSIKAIRAALAPVWQARAERLRA
jgi:hypothetical protein